MNEKRPNTSFGKLFKQYRLARDLTEADLAQLLFANSYFVSAVLVSKYESGEKPPPADFIVVAARCLKLTQDQFRALLDARFVDESQNLYDEFRSSFERDPDIPSEFPLNMPQINMQQTTPLLKVFLCHSSGDKPRVRDLYQRLLRDGFSPWLDEEALLPGQDWDQEIRKAVRNTDVVVVCLSGSSITKTGYVQKEIRFALDTADMQPENTIFIIPVKLEECEVPERLRNLQWVSLNQDRGYGLLIKALETRARDLARRSH